VAVNTETIGNNPVIGCTCSKQKITVRMYTAGKGERIKERS
jgi:hypothetical protein